MKEEAKDLEVGKWYKLTEDYGGLKKGDVFPFLKYQALCKTYARVDHYLFDVEKLSFLAPPSADLIPATTDEIGDALFEEAKRKGIVNVPITDAYGDEQEYKTSRFGTYDGRFTILRSKFGTVFSGGKWATPLETKLEKN